VSAGVEDVLSFEVDLGAAAVLGEAFGEIELGGAAGEFLEVVAELSLEGGIDAGFVVRALEVLQGGHERLAT
jgi:hypothetical protein